MIKIDTNSTELDMDSQLLVQVLNQLGSYIYVKGINRKYVYANSLLLELYNKTASSIVGCVDDEFFSGAMIEEIAINDKKVLDNKETIEVVEKNFIKDTASYKVYNSVKQPIVNSDGVVIGLFGVSTDISDSYNTREDLEKQKEGFETLFEDSSDGISIIKDHKFIKCNQKVVDILKYNSKEDILSIHPSKLSPEIQPDGRHSFEKAEEMMSLAIQNHGHQFEWMHTRADGENFWAEITLTPMVFDSDDVIHVIWRDISDRKKKETLLIEQSKLASMGEMISMIAHQWRQPLGAISSTSVNLELKIELEAFDLDTKEGQGKQNTYFREGLKDIDKYVQNLTTTIDDFRNFYKQDKKAVKVKLEEVVSKSLNIIKSSLISDNIKILQEHNSNKKIELYDNELMQVILNILKNAQDNFKEKEISKPEIIITTRENSLSICDNGGGIPEDIIDNIFDPYFSTKDEKNGTGLGLYMSKMIVQDHHNAKLSVENRADGACFTIVFSV